MNDDKVLLTFPLEFLAFSGTPRIRLDHVLSWCVVELANDYYHNRQRKEIEALARAIPAAQRPGGALMCRFDDLTLMAAMKTLGVLNGPADTYRDQHRSIALFHRDHKAKHGGSPLVRIRRNWVFEAYERKMPWKEFAAIAGLYSVLGSKRFARISRHQVRRRMMGYKTREVMDAELSNRTDGMTPLSISQTGRLLLHLATRGFFGRTRANPWQTFYSITLRGLELDDAVFNSLTFEGNAEKRRLEREGNLMARLAEAKRKEPTCH